MKKLTTFILFVFLSLLTWSCSEEVQILEPDSEFTEVDIPSHLKTKSKSSIETVIDEIDVQITNKDGSVVFGKIRLEVPTGDEETLVKLEMTSNLFQNTDLTKDFFANYYESSKSIEAKGIGSCLKDCRSIPKGEGRGWCKAGCWGELAIKAAVVVVAIL